MIDNLKLLWNKNDKTYSNNLGVSTRIPYSHGSTKGIELIDPGWVDFGHGNVLETLVDGMVDAGGKRNISIRGFPYDWRHVPSETFLDGLTSLVERTYHDNNKTRVTLLSYSAGCKYVLWLLNNKGEKYFCRTMSVYSLV